MKSFFHRDHAFANGQGWESHFKFTRLAAHREVKVGAGAYVGANCTLEPGCEAGRCLKVTLVVEGTPFSLLGCV